MNTFSSVSIGSKVENIFLFEHTWRVVIGVNHTNIYCVFSMYLCNLNTRFTPIFLKITLIPHLLMFFRIRRKIKQSDGRNQVKRKLLSLSRLLAAKERLCYSEA